MDKCISTAPSYLIYSIQQFGYAFEKFPFLLHSLDCNLSLWSTLVFVLLRNIRNEGR